MWRYRVKKDLTHCLAAYISSITSCASNCKEILSSFNGDSLNIPTHFQLAFNSFNSKLVHSEKLNMDWTHSSYFKQRELSDIIDGNQANSMFLQNDILSKSHYNLETALKSGSWLNTIPCE